MSTTNSPSWLTGIEICWHFDRSSIIESCWLEANLQDPIPISTKGEVEAAGEAETNRGSFIFLEVNDEREEYER